MTKYEFLTQLEDQLKGFVSNQELRESVAYYQEYIEEEIRKGRTEEEIFEDIGSANTVAKTIIDARGYEAETETIYDEAEIAREEERSSSTKVFHAEGWKSTAILIGIIVVLIMLLVFAFKVFTSLLPFLIPFAIILFVIKYFTGNR